MENPIHLPKQYSAGIHQFYTLGNPNSNIPLSSFITLPPVHVLTLQSSNIGIGTTLPNTTFDFYRNNMIISGNLGIGTTYARQRMDVNGIMYLSNVNIGIGTIASTNLEILGSINVSENIRIAQVSRNILDVPTVSSANKYLRRSLDNTKHEYVSIQGLKRLGTYEFTTVGTSLYRPSSNAQIILAICLGGGGGGGGCDSDDAAVRPAQGGRGGGYAARFINVNDLDVENGEIVTVGDGGAGGSGAAGSEYVNGVTGGSSSFGSFVSAVGGGRALANSATSWTGVPAGYASANAHIGACGSIQRRSGIVSESGTGGQSSYGSGAAGRTTSGSGASAVDGTGAGGAGGYATSTTARTGGAGGGGLVRVVEFGTDISI